MSALAKNSARLSNKDTNFVKSIYRQSEAVGSGGSKTPGDSLYIVPSLFPKSRATYLRKTNDLELMIQRLAAGNAKRVPAPLL